MLGYGPLMALGGIGPDALPALLSILTNAIASGTRLGAIQAIAGMGTNAAAAVPTVLRYVDDKNDMVASQAVSALGAIGPGNLAALEALEETALGPRQALQSNALEGLRSFGDQATPALIQAIGETNRGSGYTFIAFHMLAYSTPNALTNAQVIRIAAEALQSSDADRREWSAYVLRAIGQQASGTKPDFMMPISRQDFRFEDATNVLRRLAPELLP
jgi:HEAT repeat protein